MAVVIAVDSVQTAETLIPWAVLNLDSGRAFVIVKVQPQNAGCMWCSNGLLQDADYVKLDSGPIIGDITAVHRPLQRAAAHATACWTLPGRLQSRLGCVPMRSAYRPPQPLWRAPGVRATDP